MSANLQQLQQLAAQQAAVSEDMNEAQKGGGSRILPVGYKMGRVVEYIDLGSQPQEFNGKPKDPAPEFRIGIALWGEGVQEPDGSPYIIRPFSLAVSRFERSNTFKAFKTMNYTQNPQIKHFAQFVGQAFLFYVDTHTSKAGKQSSVIAWDKTLPPYDAVSKQPYAVPEPSADLYRMFLWDFPTIEAWNDLFIEGTSDDGKSKNFIQETILSALNFEGSPIHQLLLTTNTAFSIPAKTSAVPSTEPALPGSTPAVSVAAPVAAVALPATQPAQVAVPLVQPEVANVAAVPSQQVGVPASTVSATTASPTTTSPSNIAGIPGLPAGIPGLPVLPS